jgi:hypothetical protein
MLRALVRHAVAVTAVAVPALLPAHHSVSAWFDRGSIIELEGVVTSVSWQNPHVRFTLDVEEANGQVSHWDIETLSVAGISRWGITQDMIAVNGRLVVAGNPSRRNLDNLFVRNVLLPNGNELVFGGEPRWTAAERALRAGEAQRPSAGASGSEGLGFFRTWSTGSGSAFLFPEAIDPDFDFDRYPLTPAAAAALAAFDAYEDDPTRDCAPKGMPTIMEQPYPMEIVDAGDRILLRIEEYDTLRTIYMSDMPDAASQPYSRLGFSVGRWDGARLIVTTTRADWGHFDSVGIPLDRDAVLEERFTLADDGARLDYALTVTDPLTFTQPVTLEKHFIWLPDARVEPFACVN